MLGFFVGPGMGEYNWAGPLSKFRSRVLDIKKAGASLIVNAYDYNTKVVPVASYVAQLVPLSKTHFRLESAALHTVMHAPFNTFRLADFYQLHKHNGPRLRSINVACAAALFRTSAKTAANWPQWIRQMEIAAKEHLTMGTFGRNKPYPIFWDSPSYAHNLAWAFGGFQDDPKFGEAGNAINQKFRDENGGAAPNPGGDFFSKKKSVQSSAHKTMMEHVLCENDASSLKLLIRDRLTKIFDPYQLDFEGNIDLDECIKIMGTLNPSAMARVLKTWTNGWITSHRMHEDHERSCLLGCHGKMDDLSHYMQCPYIYAIMNFLIPEVSSDPLLRLGLCNPSPTKLKIVCCMFSAFHGLRAKVNAGIIGEHLDSSTSIGDGASLRRAWSVFAQLFAAEAGELSIEHRSFSLPKFIAFLVNGGTHPLQDGPPMITQGHSSSDGIYSVQSSSSFFNPGSSSARQDQQ